MDDFVEVDAVDAVALEDVEGEHTMVVIISDL